MKVAKNRAKEKLSGGSAFILAIVLMSLLAVVGAMFVMASRLDRMSASVISENKQLDFAVETIVAQISDVLAQDSPSIAGSKTGYYDCPDAKNAWLANLEPNESCVWRHISDVYNILEEVNECNLPAGVVVDYERDIYHGLPADADGDGVADSRWIVLPDVTSSKGKAIFAAIRVIDNGGMLNVNTGYKFDPNDSQARIDGSSQMQINFMGLAGRPGNPPTLGDEISLLTTRAGGEDANILVEYESGVIWQYGNPVGNYTPFDISDELALRYRFLLNQADTYTRIGEMGRPSYWTGAFRIGLEVPVGSGGSSTKINDWFEHANILPDPNKYDYRHIATTYNMDRIVDPDGYKMANVNRDDAGKLYSAIYAGLYDANYADDNIRSAAAAQIAANLIDYADGGYEVTAYFNDIVKKTYYGFERPCVYISELAHNFVSDTNDPNIIYRSYAIELFRPYYEDKDPTPSTWEVRVDGNSIPIINWQDGGSRRFFVIRFEDPNAPLAVNFTDEDEPNDPYDPNVPLYDPGVYSGVAYDINDGVQFFGGSTISLLRPAEDGNLIVVDSVLVPPADTDSGWLNVDVGQRSIERDIGPHKCIRRLWAGASAAGPGTLGGLNNVDLGGDMIQAHPANRPFINIGEIGMVFCRNAYTDQIGVYPPPIIGFTGDADEEHEVRLNLADTVFQQVFNYLTVMDPVEHGCDPNEVRIKGRININTAPWYVIAQLPWVSQRNGGYNSPALAQAIVDYRETEGGFRSIGELNNVIGFDYYLDDGQDQMGFPDLTAVKGFEPGDGAPIDFEERDLIFARISNLVTVRSDVFTAYILVRIDTDGPQKRAIAILDRSGVNLPGGKVKIVALQPVPDPR